MPKSKSRKQQQKGVQYNPFSTPAESWLNWLESVDLIKWSTLLTFIFCVYVRWTVGLNGYSGFDKPPLYGDYEAQRHWMELTIHVPIKQWYYYDLEWWGLDYPPLTAYVSWVCGKIGSTFFNPDWFALDTSRGYQSSESKIFMRASVMILEYLIYVPAVYVFVNWWLAGETRKKKNLALLLILLQPALILIDNGHFQYNSVMLGLTLWSINCFLYNHDILGSIFFCLALSFKQMALYYSPCVFAYLLGKCFKLGRNEGLTLFVKLGTTVLITFFIMFLPFLDSFTHLSQVITRIFPLQRGLYEDKVANFWCAINVVVKLREIFDVSSLTKISLTTTILAILPSCLKIGKNPDKRLLIYALLNSALAFFMFSFQVHEKSILLPLLPATLLIFDEPLMAVWIINVSVFSLYPLMKKNDLVLPYFVVWFLWNWSGSFIIKGVKSTENWILKYFYWISCLTIVILHLAEYYLRPPARYPDLHVVLNVIYCAGMFCGFLIYFNYIHWTAHNVETKEKSKED